jgi:hypothetical protein
MNTSEVAQAVAQITFDCIKGCADYVAVYVPGGPVLCPRCEPKAMAAVEAKTDHDLLQKQPVGAPEPSEARTKWERTCATCGHYDECHVDGACNGWMAGGVAFTTDRCGCAGFVRKPTPQPIAPPPAPAAGDVLSDADLAAMLADHADLMHTFEEAARRDRYDYDRNGLNYVAECLGDSIKAIQALAALRRVSPAAVEPHAGRQEPTP